MERSPSPTPTVIAPPELSQEKTIVDIQRMWIKDTAGITGASDAGTFTGTFNAGTFDAGTFNASTFNASTFNASTVNAGTSDMDSGLSLDGLSLKTTNTDQLPGQAAMPAALPFMAPRKQFPAPAECYDIAIRPLISGEALDSTTGVRAIRRTATDILD